MKKVSQITSFDLRCATPSVVTIYGATRSGQKRLGHFLSNVPTSKTKPF
jgi:hypothetical protein